MTLTLSGIESLHQTRGETVLRDNWGFDGLVMSDWGAVDDRVAGVRAGLDLEMPSSGGLGQAAIVAAVQSGELGVSVVDRAAGRVLRLVERTRQATVPGPVPDFVAHHALAREAARESAVLLRNEGDILPLDRAGGPIAVIGELARTPRYQGAGSSQVVPTRLDDALGALTEALGGGRELRFAPGYTITPDGTEPALVDEALAVARGAEVVIVFAGLPPAYESEGFDRADMLLPAHQVDLIHAVAEVNDRVVVLSNGGVVSVDPWQHRVDAVLEGWLLGQAGGGRSPTCSSVQPTRPVGWPRRSRHARRTPRASARSLAKPEPCVTERVCWSGTAGTTPTTSQSPIPSATGFPTPGSSTRT